MFYRIKIGKIMKNLEPEVFAAESGRVPETQAASRKGKPLVWCFLWNAYSLRGVTLTYDLPAPFLQNSTVPSTRAKSVWSLPIPTFSPGL